MNWISCHSLLFNILSITLKNYKYLNLSNFRFRSQTQILIMSKSLSHLSIPSDQEDYELGRRLTNSDSQLYMRLSPNCLVDLDPFIWLRPEDQWSFNRIWWLERFEWDLEEIAVMIRVYGRFLFGGFNRWNRQRGFWKQLFQRIRCHLRRLCCVCICVQHNFSEK